MSKNELILPNFKCLNFVLQPDVLINATNGCRISISRVLIDLSTCKFRAITGHFLLYTGPTNNYMDAKQAQNRRFWAK